jgi:hypothetical protein
MDTVGQIMTLNKIKRVLMNQRCLPCDLLAEVVEINKNFCDGTYTLERVPSGLTCITNSRGIAVVSILGFTLFNEDMGLKILRTITDASKE